MLTKNIKIIIKRLQTCPHTTPNTYTPHGRIKSITAPGQISALGPLHTQLLGKVVYKMNKLY